MSNGGRLLGSSSNAVIAREVSVIVLIMSNITAASKIIKIRFIKLSKLNFFLINDVKRRNISNRKFRMNKI